jgi:hypothetical protein
MLTFNYELHIYSWDGMPVPSVTQILSDTGIIVLNGWKKSENEIARHFGTAAHRACELQDRNELNLETLDPKLKPYLDCWNEFKKDYNVKVFRVEVPYYHKALIFAGTPDRIALVDGKIYVLDIKTGSSIPKYADMQTAGYKILYCDAEDIPYERVFRAAVLLNPDGKAKLEVYKAPNDMNDFISARNIYYRRSKYGYNRVNGNERPGEIQN